MELKPLTLTFPPRVPSGPDIMAITCAKECALITTTVAWRRACQPRKKTRKADGPRETQLRAYLQILVFRILCIQKLVAGVLKHKRVRRRGKPLVREPYIETSNERNDQYRCKVKRGQPFRSATSDVAQACDQCNVDYQFLSCGPILDETVPSPPAGVSPPRGPRPKTPQWLGGVGFDKMSKSMQSIIQCFGAVFRKIHAMDFYITKNQGKMMQPLTPLFQSMTRCIRKLEEQEKAAQDAKQQIEAEEPARKIEKRKRNTKDLPDKNAFAWPVWPTGATGSLKLKSQCTFSREATRSNLINSTAFSHDNCNG